MRREVAWQRAVSEELIDGISVGDTALIARVQAR